MCVFDTPLLQELVSQKTYSIACQSVNNTIDSSGVLSYYITMRPEKKCFMNNMKIKNMLMKKVCLCLVIHRPILTIVISLYSRPGSKQL